MCEAFTESAMADNALVARLSTNLNATLRLQRFRLQPGWNLCTLAAAAMTAAGLFGASAALDAVVHNDGMENLHKYAFNPKNRSRGPRISRKTWIAKVLKTRGSSPRG